MALGFFKSIVARFTGKPVDPEELEETLIRADLGVPLSLGILEKIREANGFANTDTAERLIKESLLGLFPPGTPPLRPLPARPKVILLVGVNGTGKTTSAAKLAHYLKTRRHTVLLAAADTFRAAAIEQLVAWGSRLNLEVIKGQYNGDPAALCYDAFVSAHRKNTEFLICDTAGRLHTKDNLMQELTKISRTLAKHSPDCPDEKWLVVDATTGSNGLAQAKEFHQAVGLTGIILTKLDGSGKGGNAAAIQSELGISPRFIGTGERPEDFAVFEREAFVNRLV
ncbi:MAG TPA: signal recognition particle-docking protein FtsY [Chthoniobacterales bacterium]